MGHNSELAYPINWKNTEILYTISTQVKIDLCVCFCTCVRARTCVREFQSLPRSQAINCPSYVINKI